MAKENQVVSGDSSDLIDYLIEIENENNIEELLLYFKQDLIMKNQKENIYLKLMYKIPNLTK